MRFRRPPTRSYLAALAFIGPTTPGGFAQDDDLAGYFGFEPLEVIKIGAQAGPLATADMNGDGMIDLIAVNNHESRIELHLQIPGARPGDERALQSRVNEFPEHWRFRRQLVSVTHRVMAVVPFDWNGDALMDLVYAGLPAELVFVRQSSPGMFEIARRHRVKDLAVTRDGLAVADVIGDGNPELLAVVDGEIRVWPLDGDELGTPIELAAGEDMIGFVLEDLNGDGRRDVVGLIPEDSAPVRIWLGGAEQGKAALGAQLRFDMPAIIECTTVRLPGESAARLAVIERASKRLVVYGLDTDEIESSGDRDAALEVHSFAGATTRQRDHAIVDLDGDGRLDFVATDPRANAVVAYVQQPGKGFQAGEFHPSLSDLTAVVAGNVDDDDAAELFVLSEKEGVVGRCDVQPDGAIPFPVPILFSAGRTPTALNLVMLEAGLRLAVVAKEGREYVIHLISMDGETDTIELGKLSRSPETIVALDADQDGRTDLLLLTREKPMTMLAATSEGFRRLESKEMGQYGLVKAARGDNIAVYDIDHDGQAELLIADKNFVRAVRYDPAPPAGVSPGWQVVTQINARDASSKLVSLAVLDGRLVAADGENDRLVMMAPIDDADGDGSRWLEAESLTVRGFSFRAIHAGAFAGGDEDNILAVGDDGFAIVHLTGKRATLRELDSWRTTEERRVQHELAAGDVNGDGFTDLVSLDAGEQMCEIFTFTESGRMLYAAGFQTFESRLFAGDTRAYEPRQTIIADLTGDGANDILLLVHDRVLLYPQMTETRLSAP